MSAEKKPVVGRRDFIRNLMKTGFHYDQSVRAYESMLSTIANGVVGGQSVYLGNVGAVVPVVCPPRHVNMGCMKKKGGEIVKLKREFFLDTRLKYKFRLFKKFLAEHQLDWHSS
jgi:hypothetical protein